MSDKTVDLTGDNAAYDPDREQALEGEEYDEAVEAPMRQSAQA